MEKHLTYINDYKEKIFKNRGRGLKTHLYDFLDNLPTQWEGVNHICKFVKDLRKKHYLLSEILYAIGEDPNLFFWWRLVIGSLSLREFDQLIKVMREEFLGESRLINEMELFFLSHQKKLLKDIIFQVEAKEKSFQPQPQIHEGTA